MALDRLLILGCSQKKRPDSGLLPALDRYDGPMFRVLRKFLRECPGGAQGLETYILSAEFGLMQASQPIPNYDRRMTLQQANRLKSPVLACLRRILTEKQYQRLLINVGKDYAVALSDYKWRCLTNVKMTVATGTQGYRQAELYDWLHGEPPPTLFCTKAIPYKEILTSLKHVRQTFADKEIHVFGIGGTATLHLQLFWG